MIDVGLWTRCIFFSVVASIVVPAALLCTNLDHLDILLVMHNTGGQATIKTKTRESITISNVARAGAGDFKTVELQKHHQIFEGQVAQRAWMHSNGCHV